MSSERCPECRAFVNQNGEHRKDTFTECSRRKAITAHTQHNALAHEAVHGRYDTFGWENRKGGR